MIRRIGAVMLPTLLVLSWSGTAVSASGQGLRFAGLDRATAWQRAHEGAMRARATGSPAGPLVHWTGSGTVAFHAKLVQQASEDTLPPFSSSQPDTQVEPDIAVDPNHPANVVATFQQGRFADGGSVDPGYATSLDGGLHWADGNLPVLTQAVGGPFERSSDPAVAYGPDGSVYIVTIPFDATTDCRSAVSIQRSDDHGLTFHAPVLVQDDNSCQVFNDKEWVAVDTSRQSPHVGRIYVMWSRFGVTGAPAVLRYSDDRGQTWSGLIDVSSPTAQTEGCIPLIQRNGDLTIVYDQTVTGATHPKDHEVSQTSHDGGLTFDPPVLINSFEGTGVPGMRTGGLPSAAIDPVTGDLYAAWQDSRFRTSSSFNDIVLSRSTDGGATWGPVVRVNPDPADSDTTHFTPDVAAFGGNVYVVYRTARFTNGRFQHFADMRANVSTDGGSTFTGEFVIGPRSNQVFAALAPNAFLGDYMGVAAWGGAVHAVWNVASRPPAQARFHQTSWSAAIVP